MKTYYKNERVQRSFLYYLTPYGRMMVRFMVSRYFHKIYNSLQTVTRQTEGNETEQNILDRKSVV
jgi:hypothetical protein